MRNVQISSPQVITMRTIFFLQYYDESSHIWKTLESYGTLPFLQSKVHRHVAHYDKFYFKGARKMKLRVVRGGGSAGDLKEIYQIYGPDNTYTFRLGYNYGEDKSKKNVDGTRTR